MPGLPPESTPMSLGTRLLYENNASLTEIEAGRGILFRGYCPGDIVHEDIALEPMSNIILFSLCARKTSILQHLPELT